MRQEPIVDDINIIPTKNAFAGLEIEDVAFDDKKENEDITPPAKVKPIMLHYTTNYNLVLQNLNKSFPNCNNKLTGQYIKIIAPTIEERKPNHGHAKSTRRGILCSSSPIRYPAKSAHKGSALVHFHRRNKS
ncbi:hypothetical protein TNCT_345241 [Trichonephila clavata]|uniref:Uncharacterized protein n=1 Tax=Trichonephila clavata TaxID=2740835 RepID=A0A8X6FAL7_TRICU|nr:hypothetical protein TNCT_345241 [Trichonephila clavata]